jgi:predicted small secreted protein
MKRPQLRTFLTLTLVGISLAACGAGKAVSNAGQKFDKYGCIARDFKGETPCDESETPAP